MPPTAKGLSFCSIHIVHRSAFAWGSGGAGGRTAGCRATLYGHIATVWRTSDGSSSSAQDAKKASWSTTSHVARRSRVAASCATIASMALRRQETGVPQLQLTSPQMMQRLSSEEVAAHVMLACQADNTPLVSRQLPLSESSGLLLEARYALFRLRLLPLLVLEVRRVLHDDTNNVSVSRQRPHCAHTLPTALMASKCALHSCSAIAMPLFMLIFQLASRMH